MRNILIKTSYSFSKWMGQQHVPYSHKKLTSKNYYEALSILKPGYVLLGNKHGELSNLFIPGEWKHAAIFYDNKMNKNPSVIEAVGEGVIVTDLIDFIVKRDAIAIFKLVFCDDITAEEASMAASEYIGSPYDYEFQSNNKALYCSELVWSSYREACEHETPFEMRERFGQMTVIPQDIANATTKFQKIYEAKG